MLFWKTFHIQINLIANFMILLFNMLHKEPSLHFLLHVTEFHYRSHNQPKSNLYKHLNHKNHYLVIVTLGVKIVPQVHVPLAKNVLEKNQRLIVNIASKLIIQIQNYQRLVLMLNNTIDAKFVGIELQSHLRFLSNDLEINYFCK